MPASPGIDERASRFFNDVIAFIQTIGSAPGTLRTIEQLVSSAGSIPANRAEAREADGAMLPGGNSCSMKRTNSCEF
jgi:hypothetical protein